MGMPRTIYKCFACKHEYEEWADQCPKCMAYGMAVTEMRSGPSPIIDLRSRLIDKPLGIPSVISLDEVEEKEHERYRTIEGFDDALGGGLVTDSIVLLAGSPGAGKSTKILQILDSLNLQDIKTLYVLAEESPSQVKMRAKRLSIHMRGILISNEMTIEGVIILMRELKPAVTVVDSIQRISSREFSSGTPNAIKYATGELMTVCKTEGRAVIVIGHATKEDDIAGPRTLEHLVDVSFMFDKNEETGIRTLRATKNRFGEEKKQEYEMTATGLVLIK